MGRLAACLCDRANIPIIGTTTSVYWNYVYDLCSPHPHDISSSSRSVIRSLRSICKQPVRFHECSYVSIGHSHEYHTQIT